MTTPTPPDPSPGEPDEPGEPGEPDEGSPQMRSLRARVTEENRLRRWLRRAI
ncbi:hypothetical protein [Streptomyces sp. BBFR102]|uniref:hypothetical protein n=1 Tax=Streptomyces sp. BBFR102 TaxID=3448171 RepID=UPI003F537064